MCDHQRFSHLLWKLPTRISAGAQIIVSFLGSFRQNDVVVRLNRPRSQSSLFLSNLPHIIASLYSMLHIPAIDAMSLNNIRVENLFFDEDF
jgi:hypothetical protein